MKYSDVPVGGGSLATASYPDSTTSWRARSQDEDNPTESRLRVFAIGIKPTLLKTDGTTFGTAVTRFDSVESLNLPPTTPGGFFCESTARPAEGFALCGGGASAHFWKGMYLYGLEPTSEETYSTSVTPPPLILLPDKQRFAGKSCKHLHDDFGTNTAYAMGIKIIPFEI